MIYKLLYNVLYYIFTFNFFQTSFVFDQLTLQLCHIY